MQEAGPDQLAQALDICGDVVNALRDTDLCRRTPCQEWTVRQLLNHVVATTSKFSDFAASSTDAPRTPEGNLLGADPASAFAAARTRRAAAWEHADMSRTCHLPFGTFTAGQVVAINLFDVLVHAWDLSMAVDQPLATPPAELVTTALSVADRLVTNDAVEAGVYAHRPLRPVREEGWDGLLSRTGRAVPRPHKSRR